MLLALCSGCAEWPDAQHELTDGQFGAMQFHAEPAMGVLGAGQGTDISLSFAPIAQHRYSTLRVMPGKGDAAVMLASCVRTAYALPGGSS